MVSPLGTETLAKCCISGYYLLNGVCHSCKVANCLLCDINTLNGEVSCQICENNFYSTRSSCLICP